MKSNRLFSRFVVLLLLPILVFSLGCAQREAQKTLTEAQAARDAAQGAGAPGFVPEMFTVAQNMLNQAQSQFDNGEYDQAIETANTAATRFQSAQEAVPRVRERVTAQLNDIEAALAEAEANMQQAQSAPGAGLTPQELEVGNTLVSDLRDQFESTIRSEVDEENLNAFLSQANDAVQETLSYATAHLKPQATAASDELKAMLEQARELKADIHAAGQFSQVQAQMNQLDNLERDGKWQDIIDLSDQIREPLDQIITVAQEKAAGDILQEVMAQINQAKALNVQGVEEYASNLQQAEQALRDGQAGLQQENYSLAIAAADDAKLALERANQALGTQAQALIQSAEANLQAALAQEAERYAPQVVTQVRESIAGAQELLTQLNYPSAFASAQRAAQVGAGAVDAARRGKAQISLNKVERPFSILHSQGGSKYAPEAYQTALSTVQRLRNFMQSGEYEQVTANEEESVNVVQTSLAQLAKSAAEYIEKADNAIELSMDAEAPSVVSMLHANAVNLRASAENELSFEKYLSAIQKSESAIKAANQAESRAYQLRAEQNSREADRKISLAEQAGQKTLSPLAFRKAVEAKNETQKLVNERQYQDAFERSEEAKQLADRALNNLVYSAQEQVDDALTAKAMAFAQPEISQALTLLKEAEDAQAENKFSIANDKSQRAFDLASQAEHFTYQQRSHALLRDLSDLQITLEGDLADIHTPGLYRRALNHLAEAKVKQIDEEYETSFHHADAAYETANLIYKTMMKDFAATIAELNQTANWMGENALNEAGKESKIELMNAVAELERQIALENYSEAHHAAAAAVAVAQKAAANLSDENRKVLAVDLADMISDYRSQNALAIVPDQDGVIQAAFASLKSPAADEEYADIKKKFDEAAATVNNLPDDIMTMATQRTDEVAVVLQQAQDAGSRTYYNDWNRELVSDLQWLRNSIQGQDYAEMSNRLTKLETEANELLTAAQLAASEADYLEALKVNLTQMNNTIDDFGNILDQPLEIIKASMISPLKHDPKIKEMYRQLQGRINSRTFKVNAELLEERVKDMPPPETMEKVHKKAIKTFSAFRKAAHGFDTFGESDVHDVDYREDALKMAYKQIKKVRQMAESLHFVIDSHRRLNNKEKAEWKLRKLESDFGDWYLNWRAE